MNITKCDICEKTIDSRKKSARVSFGDSLFKFFEFCPDCGKPVVEFLKSKKLIEEKKDGGE